MVPHSGETGGRFDGTFSNFLKEVLASGLDFAEPTVTVWAKETRALYASRLRSAHMATSYAIARCSHSWVDDYRTVPRALDCRPI